MHDNFHLIEGCKIAIKRGARHISGSQTMTAAQWFNHMYTEGLMKAQEHYEAGHSIFTRP